MFSSCSQIMTGSLPKFQNNPFLDDEAEDDDDQDDDLIDNEDGDDDLQLKLDSVNYDDEGESEISECGH